MLINLIREHALFSNIIKEEEFQQINAICTEVEFKKDSIIFEIDALPKYLFFVTEGSVRLQFPNEKYLDVNPGEMIGEIGILNGNFRLGKLTATKDTTLVRLDGTKLFEPAIIDASIALKLVHEMGISVTNYLRSSQQISSQEMISMGESSRVEFKSSIRWNYKAQKKDKVLESVILKTIAGFLNTNGGHLFVGVNDEGEIIGLEKDGFLNNDKLLLHLTSLIKHRISSAHLNFITMAVEQIDKSNFLRIDCLKATEPAYVEEGNNDYFYIRTGPSTTALRLSEIYSYIQYNFPNI